jgi:hypothetical protein
MGVIDQHCSFSGFHRSQCTGRVLVVSASQLPFNRCDIRHLAPLAKLRSPALSTHSKVRVNKELQIGVWEDYGTHVTPLSHNPSGREGCPLNINEVLSD